MTLRFSVTLSSKRHDLEVMADPQDTVGDLLLSAFGKVDPRWALELDGNPVDAGLLLSNVRPGSTLEVEPLPRGDASQEVAQVHVVAGPDAGRSLALPPGSHTLGEQDDHRLVLGAGVPIARLDVADDGSVRIWDAMATSPTAPHRARMGEPMMIGRFGLRVSPPRNGKPGRGPHSRPPRPSPPKSPPPTRLPGSPPPASPRPRIGWAALLAPAAMGGVMAAFVNPMMAVFALVGPLMLLTQWAEDRTGHRRRRSAEAAAFESDLHRLRVQLGSTAAAETDRIRALHPDPAEILERATTGRPTLWERRRSDEDFLTVSVGLGPRRWTPPTEPGVVGSTASRDRNSGRGMLAPPASADRHQTRTRLWGGHRRNRLVRAAGRHRFGHTGGGPPRPSRSGSDTDRHTRPGGALGVAQVAPSPPTPHRPRPRHQAAVASSRAGGPARGPVGIPRRQHANQPRFG